MKQSSCLQFLTRLLPQRTFGFVLVLLVAASVLLAPQPSQAAGPVSFTQSNLQGETLTRPTSLQFGPDGRLYVAQQNGVIFAYRVVRNAANNYTITQTEQINLIQQIPNHNDDGVPNAGVNTRQVTGLLVTGTAANPVLYVSSSDPRRGLNNDTGLDTNSGIVSRLTWNGAAWQKLDLVRGLPRSEEYHSVNGMELDIATNTLYLAVGGHANMGAPSGTLSWLPEYALSAAILAIDLNAIGNTTYDLPTVDDPTRPNTGPGGADQGDPFGGNDGRNQARVVPGGPVRLYSTGYRNPYDLVISQAGRMYTVDNGSNSGWGGPPVGEGTANCTNQTVETGALSTPDNLHLVTDGFYAGNAAPIRGNPAGAGLWDYNPATQTSTLIMQFTVDNTPVPFNMANPIECDYRQPLVDDGALYGWNYSTNGITEYTATNFGGNMRGDLLAAGYNGTIQRVELNANGTAALNVSAVFTNFGSTPLDVTAQGDNDIFPGTVWAAVYGAQNIAIFEPTDYNGGSGLPCTRADDINLDEDNDGYSNADELDNNTDPCNAGSRPEDFDDDDLSNLNDPDDDNDGILDVNDEFAIDPQNGQGTNLPVNYSWNGGNPGFGLLDLGFTGIMITGATDYLTQYNTVNMTWGGAAGKVTVDAIPAGSATSNTQAYAFQFGINTPNTQLFTARTAITGPLFDGRAPVGGESIGLFIGSGDQDNYLRVVLGVGGITVAGENGGAAYSNTYPATFSGAQVVELFLSVNPTLGTVQPKFLIDGGAMTNAGPAVTLPVGSELHTAITGAPAVAVGIISTSAGGSPFTGTWDYLEVSADAPSVLAAVPNPENFGTVQTGQTRAEQVTLTNMGLPGDPAIQISGFNLPAGVYTLANVPQLPLLLNPGQSATVDVVFAPTAVGPANVDLSVTHTGANSPYVVQLIGQGFAPVIALYRVNVGGPQIAATDGGIAWGRDQAGGNRSPYVNNNGSVYTNNVTITNTTGAPNALFIDERWDAAAAPNMLWTFPIAQAGQYEVRLYFAEICTCIGGAGGRVFDVTVEGQLVLDNYDQFARTGGRNIAIRESIITTVNDGSLNIEFIHQTENPSVKAIEILPYAGAAPQATLTLTPSPVDFGSATVSGAAVTQQVTLTNTGVAGAPNITITAITIGGSSDANQFNTAALTQPIVLAPGQTRNVVINFQPTSAGAKSATLQVTHNGSNPSPATAQLNGVGAASGAALTIAPPNIDFGSVNINATSPQTITLTHPGAVGAPNITVTAITISGADAGQFNTPALAQPMVLAAGQSQQITVNFAPTTAGIKTATLNIAHNGSNGPTGAVGLTGAGAVPPAALTLPGAAVNFGQVTVNASGQQQITVTHSGAAGTPDITLTSIAIGGTDAALFSTPALAQPIVLTPGQTHTFTVTFTPTSTGAKTAQVQIAHNGSNGPTSSIPLEGNGSAGAVSTVLYRVNAGGPQVNAADGSLPVWAADTQAAPSAFVNSAQTNATYQVGNAINMTHPSLVGLPHVAAALFQTERYDAGGGAEMQWNFPVTAGNTYEIRLFFGEIFLNQANIRAFDVQIEGIVPAAMNDIDPYVQAGNQRYRGFVLIHTLVAADNNLDIDLLHIAGRDNPKIDAIEILQTNSVAPTAGPLNANPTPVTYGNVNVGATVAQQITLTHGGAAGTADITITAITLGGADGGQFNTPALAQPIVLTPGQTHTFTVNFVPTTPGVKAAQVQIAHNGSNGPQTNIPLNGTGVAVAALTLAPNPVAFGNVNVNANSTQQVTLTHSGAAGTANITITAITLAGGDAAMFNTPTLAQPIVLTPGQVHQFNVNFVPTSGGLKTTTLQIAHNGSNGPQSDLPLNGTGMLPAAALTLPPGAVNFGNVNVGATGSQQITLTHSGAAGTADITITAITLGGADAAQFNTPALAQPIVLTPGQAHTFTVTFAPTTPGAKVAQVQIAHNGSNGPTGNIALNGAGVAVPPATGTALFRINVGGPQLNAVDNSLPVFGADTAAAPSAYNTNAAATTVSAPYGGAINMAQLAALPHVPQALFSTQRFDAAAAPAMQWDFPVTAGQQYVVRLYFMESFHNAANVRRFNVLLEGSAVLTNFDIWQAAGGRYVAIFREFTITPADNNIDLDFAHVTDNPALRGIEILAVNMAASTLSAAPDPVAFGDVIVGATGTQTLTLTNTGTAGINVTALAFNNAVFTHNAVLPLTIPAGQQAAFNIALAPTAAGAQNGVLTITHNGSNGPTITVNLAGNALSATLGAAPNPVNFGDIATGATGTQPVTLTNTGTAPITITALALDNAAVAHNAVLPLTILAGQQGAFNLTFTPAAVGIVNATLTITHNAANGPTTVVNVNANGIAPASTLSAAPNPLAFGDVTVAATGTQALILTNTGSATITVTALALDNILFAHSAVLPLVIPAGQQAAFNLTFTPAATGAQAGILTITHDAANGPTLLVNLTANGVTTPASALGLAPNPVVFGSVTVGASGTQQITLTNTGTALIDVTTLAFDNVVFTHNALLPLAIPAGQQAAFNVIFTPTAAGLVNATLTLTHNATNGPTSVVNISGTGVDPAVAVLAISPNPMNFGQAVVNNAPVRRDITLTNTGGAGAPTITINALTLGGLNADQFRLPPLANPVPLAGGQSYTFTAEFVPTIAGAQTATITIAHDNGTATPTDTLLPLNGEGIYPITAGLQASPLALDFGTTAVNDAAPDAAGDINTPSAALTQNLTLTYNGNAGDPAVTIGLVTISGANADQFRHNFAAPVTLNVGQSTVIAVTFAPTSAGAKTASLDITHTAPNGPITQVALSGTGTVTTLVINPGTPGGQTPVVASGGALVLGKSANPPFALPGAGVTWTVTVQNPNPTAVANVTVVDDVPADLEVISASASSGAASTNGQAVSLTLPQLAPGETVTLTIETRIRPSAQVPFALVNQACVGSQCATAQVLSVTALPSTGQSPWSAWRGVIFGLGLLTLSVVMGGILRREFYKVYKHAEATKN